MLSSSAFYAQAVVERSIVESIAIATNFIVTSLLNHYFLHCSIPYRIGNIGLSACHGRMV